MTHSSATLDFWFDFNSPYAHFAAFDVEALAEKHGRRVRWRPFLLGVVFRQTGMGPLPSQPLRGDYGVRDWDRMARRRGRPFALPSAFPINPVAPSRILLSLAAEGSAVQGAFVRACSAAMFERDVDISAAAACAAIGAEMGLDPAALAAAGSDPQWKDALRAETEAAEAAGVFGAPFVIVDGEPFWGADRLSMVDDWLASGGW